MSRYRDVVQELTAYNYKIEQLEKKIKEYENKEKMAGVGGQIFLSLKTGEEFSHRFNNPKDAQAVIKFLSSANLIESYITE